jgi:phospholipid transport system substrate-binding protein
MYVRSIARLLLVATCALPALPPNANAATVATDPSALITQLGAQVTLVLNDTRLTAPERQEEFRILLDQDFDFPTISRLALGRYWQASSDSFHQEFGTVFENYVIQSLSTRFARYHGESISVTTTHAEGEHGTVVSTTIIHPNGEPPEVVDWRVENSPHGYKIVDVSVSGVSIAVAYREQFATEIDHGGGEIAVLIPDLQQKPDGSPSDASALSSQAQDAN